MPSTSSSVFAALAEQLKRSNNPVEAEAMAQYMRHRFDFYGIRSGPRRQLQRPLLNATTQLNLVELKAFVDLCWDQPQREFQYAAVDVLRKNRDRLKPTDLDDVVRWITTKPWWDTVDFLAPHIVGTLVQRHPEHTRPVVDSWITNDDFWLARSTILHQLLFKDSTDADRLFAYCDARAADTEFFVRKALGWALRQYARVDASAVITYVKANDAVLSPLTKREALKHLSVD